MRVILDECLPRRLARHLTGHQVTTVPSEGFSGLSNGRLLDAIQEDFDAFVTIDANLEYQQALKNRPLLVVVLKSTSNRLEDVVELVPGILEALGKGKVGDVVHVAPKPNNAVEGDRCQRPRFGR